MTIRFCKDCLYFEDRRDIDDTVLCTENMRPCICCEEFQPNEEIQPKYGETNWNRSCDRFCVKCTSFENINGIALCSKNHQLEVACKGFRSTFERSTITRKNNHLETVSTSHTLNAKSEESLAKSCD